MRSPVFRRRVSATCGDGGGTPRKCHPGGGGRPSSHHTKIMRYTADTQYTILGATAPHPSGVRFGGCPSAVPACRRHPGRRNTGLRTAATPRGVAEMSASGHRAMHRIAWALPACRHDPATYQSIRYRGRLYRPRVAKYGHRLRRVRRGGRCAAPDLAALAAAAMRHRNASPRGGDE